MPTCIVESVCRHVESSYVERRNQKGTTEHPTSDVSGNGRTLCSVLSKESDERHTELMNLGGDGGLHSGLLAIHMFFFLKTEFDC